MEREFLEEQLAAGRSLEQIGAMVDRDPSTVGYWVKKHGLIAKGRDKYAPRGGLALDRLAPLVERGATTREVARECGVSYSTARYWLARHGLSTRRRRERVHGPLQRRIERHCATHGTTTFVLEGRGYYRCCKCRMERVAERRRKVKRILVEEAGGACSLCGFDEHPAALQFHHLDPTQKEFQVSLRGVTRGIEALREEARKCVLLCSNCHALVEVGALSVPTAAVSAPRPGFEPGWPD
jgi:Homeodomain-like domain